MEEVSSKQFEQNKNFLDKVPFFQAMTENQKEAIAGALISQKFNPGEIIVNEGDLASSYYIIKEVASAEQGTVECIKDGKVVRELNEGDSFGEAALYASGQRTLSVRSKGISRCLALGREALQNILGSEIQSVIYNNSSRWSLEKNKVFEKLAKVQMEKWIRNAKVVKREKGEVLAKRGEKLKTIFLFIEGEGSFKGQVYPKFTAFGDAFVYPDSSVGKQYAPLTRLDDNLVVHTAGQISEIEVDRLNKLFDGTFEEVFNRNEKGGHEVGTGSPRKNSTIKTRTSERKWQTCRCPT